MPTSQARQAVAAKIRARYGRFFTKETYAALAACSSLSELQSALLENADFTDVFGKSNDVPHRYTVEQLLRVQFYYDLESLLQFDRFVGSQFYTVMTDLVTVELLLSFARHYNAGTLNDFQPEVSNFFQRQLSFDVQGLVRARTIPELLSLFASHPFLPALADNIPEGENPIHLANLEYSLLNAYYGRVTRLFESDPGSYREARQILGMMVDIENLQKMIRARPHQQSADASIHLLPYGNYSVKQLTGWYEGSFEQMIAAIQKSCYGPYLNSDLPPDFALKRALHLECSKKIRRLRQVSAIFLCYIILSRSRLDCLTTITEGIRYQMAPEVIVSLLPV